MITQETWKGDIARGILVYGINHLITWLLQNYTGLSLSFSFLPLPPTVVNGLLGVLVITILSRAYKPKREGPDHSVSTVSLGNFEPHSFSRETLLKMPYLCHGSIWMIDLKYDPTTQTITGIRANRPPYCPKCTAKMEEGKRRWMLFWQKQTWFCADYNECGYYTYKENIPDSLIDNVEHLAEKSLRTDEIDEDILEEIGLPSDFSLNI